MYRQSEKNLLSSNTSSTCPYNMVNFGPLTAEILSLVWGTPANFNGFRVLAALGPTARHLVVGVSQSLRRWTEGSPVFGRATITLGIGPHSSYKYRSLTATASVVWSLVVARIAFIANKISVSARTASTWQWRAAYNQQTLICRYFQPACFIYRNTIIY